MAKAKKPAVAPKKMSAQSPDRAWSIALHVMGGIIFISCIVIFVRVCQIYVDRNLDAPTHPPLVTLANRPAWMSDVLAEQIIKSVEPIGLHSTFDRQLLVDTAEAMKSNPWVRQVRGVRRVFDQTPGDTLEIDCEYRAPVALVKWGQYFWLVDGQGIALPEQYTNSQLSKIMLGNDGRINVRIIVGAAHAPPEAGQIWPGGDLAGGLELAKVVADHDWADDIRQIDVSNFGGRRNPRDAQIVFDTQYGTRIRWGRPPSAKDAFVEPTASVKLAALQNIYEQMHRVDANQPWIDLRFDQVLRPKQNTETTTVDARR